jgi:hypothetical protein
MECAWNIFLAPSAPALYHGVPPTTDQPVFPDLSSDAAREQLEPYHAQFVAAIKEGVRLFNTMPPSLLYRLVKWKRVKANSMWAFIVDEIENTFREVPGVTVKPRYGSVEIEVGKNMVARIKKMRPDGFTSNYPTARVGAFHSADQGELFAHEWAQPMKVDIGYIEDETGTHIAEILVARRNTPSSIAWTYPMTSPATITAMPVETAASAETGDTTRIVAREADNAAQGTDDE